MNMIYTKSTPAYNVRLGIALREKQKKLLNLFVTLYRRAVSSFVSLIAPPI